MQPCSVFARRKEDRLRTTAMLDRRVSSAIVRTPKGRFTQWAREEMIRQRKSGQTILEIMTRFGASESVVRNIVGTSRGKPKNLKDIIDPAVVVSLMKEGRTWGFIGDYFGVAESTVRRKVKWRKIKPAHDLQYEEWRPIVGLEGIYEVSSEGRVRSLTRTSTRTRKNGHTQVITYRGRLIGQHQLGGCLRVSIFRDGVRCQRQVHMLVCEAFHGPPPKGKPYVEFADGNLQNNAAENLKWTSTRSWVVKNLAGRKLVLR